MQRLHADPTLSACADTWLAAGKRLSHGFALRPQRAAAATSRRFYQPSKCGDGSLPSELMLHFVDYQS